MTKSYCGMNCLECVEYQKGCLGCSMISGKPIWASELEECLCPIYACCVVDRKLPDCKACHESFCKVKSELEENRL